MTGRRPEDAPKVVKGSVLARGTTPDRAPTIHPGAAGGAAHASGTTSDKAPPRADGPTAPTGSDPRLIRGDAPFLMPRTPPPPAFPDDPIEAAEAAHRRAHRLFRLRGTAAAGIGSMTYGQLRREIVALRHWMRQSEATVADALYYQELMQAQTILAGQRQQAQFGAEYAAREENHGDV